MIATRPLWRRIVDRLLPADPVPEAWFALHDQVPSGGDVVTTRTEVRLGWRGLARCALLGGRLEIETRTITRQPVAVVASHGRTYIG